MGSVDDALALARDGLLVTLGVSPTFASTAYGYVRVGSPLGKGFKLEEFIEKPDKPEAEILAGSGTHLWNSGMFFFNAGAFLEELRSLDSELFVCVESAVLNGSEVNNGFALSYESFSSAPDLSIDYAVMEKTTKGAIVPLNADWSDLGTWDVVAEKFPTDIDGGNNRHFMVDGDRNFISSSTDRAVALLGLSDIAVVDTDDALLVMNKASASSLKKVTEEIANAGQSELLEDHKTVIRPWGSFTSLTLGDNYQVKLISVKPGQKLSVQKHFHRSEHWVVVGGEATVLKGKQLIKLSVNESIYLAQEEIHSLQNEGESVLNVIEVQVGSYLGEDDIVRISDDYGRV
jgi:mannose-1-phosphate guanylyltransferase/mannose-6-phosphate isomerase